MPISLLLLFCQPFFGFLLEQTDVIPVFFLFLLLPPWRQGLVFLIEVLSKKLKKTESERDKENEFLLLSRSRENFLVGYTCS